MPLKMFSVASILLVTAIATRVPTSDALNVSCSWYPSDDYRDVAMQCVGPEMDSPPMYLPEPLQQLRLVGTSLWTLDNSTFQRRHLPVLSSLLVTQGRLKSVGPRALCSLPQLDQLSLSHNELERLDPMSFECNKNLRSLDLSNNPTLTHLPRLDSQSVEKIFAENCSLTDIEDGVLDGLTNLKKIYLDGNAGLDCSSSKERMSRQLPHLAVICENLIHSVTTPSTTSESNTLSGTNADIDLKHNTENKTPKGFTATFVVTPCIYLSAFFVGIVLFFRYRKARKYILVHDPVLTRDYVERI